MAKTAARSSRSRGRSTDAEASGSLKAASEVLGLVIVALAALCALAIATFDAGDPVFRLTEVQNAAGAVGASLAGTLVGLLGTGSLALVGAMAWLGVRLVLGLGIPGFASRFWVGTSWTELSGNPAFRKAAWTTSLRARLVCAASEPPRRMATFPLRIQSAAASRVTLGLDS